MNPLALPGPQFLVFYTVYAVVVLLVLYFGRRALEGGTLPALNTKDPYVFACLNGGPAGVIRVATLGLIDRGLLQLTGSTARTAQNAQSTFGQSQIERRLLDHFRTGATVSSAWEDHSLLVAAGNAYEEPLKRSGLLPGDKAAATRRTLLAVALAAILVMGLAKIAVALSAGRTNVLFLIGLMVVAIIVIARIWNPYRTKLGDEYLESVRSLFDNLRARAPSLQPGGGSRDVLWLTALFGAGMLPSAAFPAAAHVWPRPVAASTAGSCGSSSCSSGCGGGGGGCGGCGS